ncbi:MAG: hypothetical protein LKE75_08495 [Lachnospiraceae bacterium]|jgi:hypothetical protein|nr:hypothetical protein [Lachnospiraceae bacterium]MCH4031444.1 hypothetical protein [Lachnospiraceae bacterium]MCH4071012.1 hypothetical protein [Lachnospiraceae bacterium]MCH4107998.1 hypothetical protein [Lachnospiraceae bacterium]MCI1302713.1 hypothetical protein [Lachnospiraceae bacterium]
MIISGARQAEFRPKSAPETAMKLNSGAQRLCPRLTGSTEMRNKLASDAFHLKLNLPGQRK